MVPGPSQPVGSRPVESLWGSILTNHFQGSAGPMSRPSRVFVASVLAVFFSLPVAGCAGVSTHPAPAASTSDPNTQNDKALAAYVDAERATIPQILKLYPGVYSDVTIDASQRDSSGIQGIPEGNYSVVVYQYVFADTKDWSQVGPALDTQKSVIDGACTKTIFPAMKSAGVTGAMAALYEYGDAANGIQWTYACSAQN